MFQWILADNKKWTTRQKVLLLCIADTILFVVSSAGGFIALWLVRKLLLEHTTADIGVGTTILIIFLGLFGILGIADQLPQLIQEGKLLPPTHP
jgi:hypothetical protein